MSMQQQIDQNMHEINNRFDDAQNSITDYDISCAIDSYVNDHPAALTKLLNKMSPAAAEVIMDRARAEKAQYASMTISKHDRERWSDNNWS